MKTCPNCHWTSSDDDMKFCKNCGTRLVDTPAASSTPASAATSPDTEAGRGVWHGYGASLSGSSAASKSSTTHSSASASANSASSGTHTPAAASKPTPSASAPAASTTTPSTGTASPTSTSTSTQAPGTYGMANIKAALGNLTPSTLFASGGKSYGQVDITVDNTCIYLPTTAIAKHNVAAIIPSKSPFKIRWYLVLALALSVLFILMGSMGEPDFGTLGWFGLLAVIAVLVFMYLNSDKSLCLCLTSGDKVNIISKNQLALANIYADFVDAVINGGSFSASIPSARIDFDLK